MSQKYLIRIAELERLLSEQAEALRQKDQQLSLVEETEAFLRSALTRAEEKIEEDEREIEHLRAQIEKLRRMLFGTRSEKLRREVELAEALLKQREQDSDRYSGREDDPQVPRQLRQSRHRRPLPAHLPREIHRLEPEESCCPECGGELDYLGEVSAEQLELVSSALKVIRTERVKKPVQNVTVLLKHRRVPPDRAWYRGPRITCPRVDGKILRTSATVSSE